MSRDAVRSAFPELAAIEDEQVRTGVLRAWTRTMEKYDVSDLSSLPWFPPLQREFAVTDERLVPHVRDVTNIAISLVETLHERRDIDLSLDIVIAGAIIHDVSKLAEFDGMNETQIGDLLGHPYFGVYIVEAADLPLELAHIVLSHTSRTNVEPATIEAELVRRADEIATAAILSQATDDLRS